MHSQFYMTNKKEEGACFCRYCSNCKVIPSFSAETCQSLCGVLVAVTSFVWELPTPLPLHNTHILTVWELKLSRSIYTVVQMDRQTQVHGHVVRCFLAVLGFGWGIFYMNIDYREINKPEKVIIWNGWSQTARIGMSPCTMHILISRLSFL